MNEQLTHRPLTELPQVFRDLPIGFCTFDLDFRYVFVNEWLAALNGVTAAAHLGRTIQEVIPDVAAGVEAQLRQVVETGEPIVGGEVEAETPAFPGEKRVFQHTYSAIKDTDDQTIGLSCLVQDITEQRRVEDKLRQAGDLLEARVDERTAALQKSEARLRLVNDALPVMIAHIDADMRYISINKCGADWLAQPADDIAGRPVEEVHGANFEKIRPHVDKVLSGETTVYETTLTYPDGVTRDIRVAAAPDIASDGLIRGYFALVEDMTHRNLAEKAVRESREQLIDAIESISEGFILYDADERFILRNSKYLEFYPSAADVLAPGARLEDVARAVFLAGDVKGADENIEEWMNIRLDLRRKERSTHEQQLKDGRWLLCSETRTRSGGSVSIRTDITALKQADEVLRQQQAYTHAILANMVDALITIDETGKVMSFNPAAEHTFGYGADEVIGRNVSMLMQEVDHLRHDGYLSRYVETGKSKILGKGPREVVGCHKNGTEVPLELAIGRVDTAEGTFFIGSLRDISVRMELERERNLLSKAVEGLSEGIALWDADDRLVICNGRFIKLSGTSLETAKPGVTFEQVIRAVIYGGQILDAVGREEAFFEERLRLHENPVRPFEREMSDGRWSLVSEQRTLDGGSITIITDITEQKRVEEQLRQAQKMEAIGQLTGGVAHDFNNLLAVIMGNLELLIERTESDSKISNFAARAFQATRRGAELTHRLLAFSRRQPLQPVLIDVNQLVKDLQDLLVRTLGEVIEIELVAGAGVWQCEVDPGQLENVILNLSINARDAMPQGGRLTIETSNTHLDDAYAAGQEDVAPGQYVLLAISDTGTGMPPEVIAQAFDPFFTTKEVGEGSGLGLSMIYGFVKQSGGHARIYSEVGEGTTMKIYLPRSTADEGAGPDTDAHPVADTAARGEVVLVVEDDAEVRKVAVSILDELGYDVLEAGTADAALEQIEPNRRIDLLITDIILPGGTSGRELADKAYKLLPSLKVLYMSGYAESAIMHHGRLDQGVQLLVKPFGRSDLAVKVREILDRAP